MTILVVQARMGSTRLPGKVLKEIKGVPLLEIQYRRIVPSKLVDKIIIATTSNHEDDKIEEFCVDHEISCFRGSDWDVLDRYYQAAKTYSADTIVRITADCPLHHHTVIDFVAAQYVKSGTDYFSNSNNEPEFLEDGFDVEVFSWGALQTAWKQASMLSEREHVTPFIKNSGLFKCGWKKFRSDYQYKLSVDSQADLEAVKTIFNSFDSITDFGMQEVIELLENKPEILNINQNSTINSGYRKSLDNDKKVK
jgi:spore coat polysaccharide biosynthesis protein SpsF (cytidylyltransferase family)